jgi:hypothetical protein
VRVWLVSESSTYRVEAETAEEATESLHRARLLDSEITAVEDLTEEIVERAIARGLELRGERL